MNIFYFMELSMKKRKIQQFLVFITKTADHSMCTLQCITLQRQNIGNRAIWCICSSSQIDHLDALTPFLAYMLVCRVYKHLDFKIERKIYFTTSESLMFKLRLRLKFQETLSIKFTATKKPGKKKTSNLYFK